MTNADGKMVRWKNEDEKLRMTMCG